MIPVERRAAPWLDIWQTRRRSSFFGAASESCQKSHLADRSRPPNGRGLMLQAMFFAYADNYHRVRRDRPCRGLARHSPWPRWVRPKTMIDRTEDRFGLKPAIAADTAWMDQPPPSADHTCQEDCVPSATSPTLIEPKRLRFDAGRNVCNVTARQAAAHDSAGSMMAGRFSIGIARTSDWPLPAQGTVLPKAPEAQIRVSTKTFARMLPVRWPALRRSSNRATIANGSRCCSPILKRTSQAGSPSASWPKTQPRDALAAIAPAPARPV